jgi:hypothetical protein
MATSVDAKLLKQTKFPPEFSQKVDMKKVNVEVMKKYGREQPNLTKPASTNSLVTGGSQVRYLRSLGMKTMLSSSSASIFWRAHAL